MLDILYLNNYHYLRGGAESVFLSEKELMKKRGNAVHIFARKHPNNLPSRYDKYFARKMVTDAIRPTLEGLRSLALLIYNVNAKRRLALMLQDIHVDVAHAHNIYGGLTTSVLDLLAEKKIPILMTLHDYKLICPNYKLMFRGRVCEDCKSGKYYMAVRNRCHKDSYLASLIYAFETYFNERLQKYRKNIQYLLAPSKFIKKKFIEFKWPETQIEYVPNFLFLSKFEPRFTPGNYFLYIGRLSSEKGIQTLISAFTKTTSKAIKFMIVGEGPIRKKLEKIAAVDPRIFFTGYLSGDSLSAAIKNALAVIVPSEWYENAPISILEAFAFGKPVIGSRIGGIPEMIDDGANGYLFEAGNEDELTEKLKIMIDAPKQKISEMGRAARQKAENQYNAQAHYERLMDVYRRALRMM